MNKRILLGLIATLAWAPSLAPAADSTPRLGQLYSTKKPMQVSKTDFQCLVKNIFHEAGVENLKGKIAVAQITLNRLKSGRWGNTVCQVVMSPSQFSWTLERRLKRQKPRGQLWEQSVRAAHLAVSGARIAGLEYSHFYHTDYIKTPNWARSFVKLAQIGQHVFYAQPVKNG